MKTVDEVLSSARPGWAVDLHGIGLRLDGEDIEVRIEPLLFGAAYLAVYRRNHSEDEWDLVGEKMPITLGTPAQNEWPITKPQLELIETLRIQQNVSADVINRLCQRHWERDLGSLGVRQASALIDSLKTEKAEIKREIQIIAGQRSLL